MLSSFPLASLPLTPLPLAPLPLSPACPLGQLLARHLPAWLTQPLNAVAAPGSLHLPSLHLKESFQAGDGAGVSVWTADWRVHQSALTEGLASFFVSQQAPDHLPGKTLLFWPKAREEGYWWLQQLLAYRLDELYLIGENQGGVKAAAKALNAAGLEVSKLDSARRCSIYQVHRCQQLSAALPDLLHKTRYQGEMFYQGPGALELFSLPGVFGQGRVDAGSLLLLEAIKAQAADLPWKGKLLDLGCGNGLLGAWLLKQRPECQLLASDVSGFALIAARTTLEINRLAGCVLPADIFTGLEKAAAPGQLNQIISNPPFHTGKATDYELSQRLIRDAPQWLKPGGQLWLVANRFLPYPDLLQAAFGSFHRRAETGKFTVYQAIKKA